MSVREFNKSQNSYAIAAITPYFPAAAALRICNVLLSFAAVMMAVYPNVNYEKDQE